MIIHFSGDIMLKFISDDLEYVAVIASLPSQQTVFEYLVGCWKRLNSERAALLKKVRKGSLKMTPRLFLIITVYLGISTHGDPAGA
jgi:hypothetical protein